MDLPALAFAAGLAAYSPVVVPTPKAKTQNAVLPPLSVSDMAVSAASGGVVSWPDLISSLMSARVIAVGEKHDEASHHRVQAAVVSSIAALDPNVVVGLEMVSQDLQPGLDDFMSGKISESDFIAFWKKAWGYDYALYKPIFDAARARHLRVVGLNAPISLVLAVAKKGLAGLTLAERAALPFSIQESSDPRYRSFVHDSLAGHKLPPDAEARMTEAQAVWNEVMGAKTAELARDSRVLVIAGQGHMLWRAGIPESAARRGVPSAAVVLPYPLDGEVLPLPEQLSRLQDPAELSLADDFVLIP